MLTARETATVLAALRRWQKELVRRSAGLTQHDLHFTEHTPLNASEIDGLCQWFNLAETCEVE